MNPPLPHPRAIGKTIGHMSLLSQNKLLQTQNILSVNNKSIDFLPSILKDKISFGTSEF